MTWKNFNFHDFVYVWFPHAYTKIAPVTDPSKMANLLRDALQAWGEGKSASEWGAANAEAYR